MRVLTLGQGPPLESRRLLVHASECSPCCKGHKTVLHAAHSLKAYPSLLSAGAALRNESGAGERRFTLWFGAPTRRFRTSATSIVRRPAKRVDRGLQSSVIHGSPGA